VYIGPQNEFERARISTQEKRPVIPEDKRPVRERELRLEIYTIGLRNAKGIQGVVGGIDKKDDRRHFERRDFYHPPLSWCFYLQGRVGRFW
jgi:hypothetical protein